MGHCSSRNCKLEPHFERFNLNNKNLAALQRFSLAPTTLDSEIENQKLIDHRPVFMSNDTSLMKGITFFYGEYIVGLKVNYHIHSQPVELDLMGYGHYQNRFSLRLKDNEFIEHLILFYDLTAVVYLKIWTTDGRVFTVGNKKDDGVNMKEIDLSRHGRVILGFKGQIGEFLHDLWIYHAEICLL